MSYPDELPHAEGGYKYLPDGSRVNVAEIQDDWRKSFDLFGTPVVKNTRNVADLASHYPFNPERWRLFLNGARQLPQYGSVADFTDQVDSYLLQPSTSGDVMRIETAERFRYVVGYVLAFSFAFRATQSLGSGDKITVAYGDADLDNDMASADGWVLEYEPDLSDKEARMAIYRDGTIVSNGGEKKVVTFEQAITTLRRKFGYTDWYGVGPYQIGETYTSEGEQLNPIQGKVSNDGGQANGRSAQTGNHRVQFAIKSGGNGTGLEVGSISLMIQGAVSALEREKQAPFINKSVSSTGVYEPVLALRINPDFNLITSLLTSVDLLSFAGSNSVRLHAAAFAESKVSFGSDGWSTPAEWSGANNAVQVREDVTGYPDSTGSEVASSDTWTDDPGGYQVGFSILSGSGTGNTRNTSTERKEIKRPFNEPDIVVILANAESTNDFDFELTVQQDW